MEAQLIDRGDDDARAAYALTLTIITESREGGRAADVLWQAADPTTMLSYSAFTTAVDACLFQLAQELLRLSALEQRGVTAKS